MKQTLLFLTLLFAGTLSAQVEHWKINYRFGKGDPMQAEIYAAPGKFYMSAGSGEMTSRSFTDSSKRQMLQLNDVMENKEYTLYYFDGADVPETIVRTAPDGTEYTVTPKIVPVREPQREGVDFEVLKQTKKKNGLVLQKVNLTLQELESMEEMEVMAEGWIVKGKMINCMTPYVFTNGEVGTLVESEITFGGTTIRTELVLFEEVAEIPEGLFSMEIPEGYVDSDKEQYDAALEAEEYGGDYSDYEENYEYYERYVPSGKPEPETQAAEQWKLFTTSDSDVDVETDIYIAPGKYRVDREEAYNEKTTVVDSSVYWRVELEDHGYSYYRLEAFYGSKANTDSLEKPGYITNREPRLTAAEGEAFRLLGDTKVWNGLKLYHVAMLTWKDDWAQGEGWLLPRVLPGLDDEPVFVLKDGRKGTLIEYDFYVLGPVSEPRPDSLHPDVPEAFIQPELVEDSDENDVEAPVFMDVYADEELNHGDWDIEVPEVIERESAWYDEWTSLRWDSSIGDFDGPLPDMPDIDASDSPYGIEDYDDSWHYPESYNRKLMLYGKTVVSGKLFSLTPPKEYYDMQTHEWE